MDTRKETNAAGIPATISSLHHTVCGTIVTWKLGDEGHDGSPHCAACDRRVTFEEVSSRRAICVTR